MLKHLYKTLKSSPKIKNPNSLILISHIHTYNKTLISNPAIDFVLDEFEDLQPSNQQANNPTQSAVKTAEPIESKSSTFQISHQWPEWVVLMEKLIKNGYFDGVGNPFRNGGRGELIDGKSCNQIRTACLNFARDRPEVMRYFASRDIQTVAGYGCPTIDRKVVNSGKRLRAYIGIDEENACSSCILRGNCERAYVKAHENGVHTVDIMRFVVTYGLDHNKSFIDKRVQEAIRSLIKDMVKYSQDKLDISDSKRSTSVHRSQSQHQEQRSDIPTTHSDWNCSKCKFLNFAKNDKCARCDGVFHEKLQRSGKNQDQVELKKGDWLCIRCNFLNYAKNTRCLKCDINPPKRQLNPGEWACDSCNYINFKRNMVCLKCGHKRPKAFNSSTTSVQLNYANR